MLKNIYKLILSICIATASICGYQLWTMVVDDAIRQAELAKTRKKVIKEEKSGNEFNVDWDALKAQNPELVGWIYVPFCGISHPVVQSANNEFYLNHGFEGGYDEYGTVFLDSAASGDFSSENSILYGHSSFDGKMFSGLSNYRDSTFFTDHPYFYILTPTQNYKVDIVAFLETTYYNDFYNIVFGDNRTSMVENMIAQARYTNPSVDTSQGNFISLSTCNLDAGLNSEYRFLLTGIAQPIDSVEYED